MVNHSALYRSIKYDYINILTWTILKKIQILNGCETFAFKYIILCIGFNQSELSHASVVYRDNVENFKRFCFDFSNGS